MIGIVCSRADEASEAICEQLLEIATFEARTDDTEPDSQGGGTYHHTRGCELRSFDDLHLELDGVADAFEADVDYVVFASRHAGDTGELLSAHVTGNFGDAEYGGADRALAEAPPYALATVLQRLAAHAPDGYEVALECTHHGPTDVGAPSMFVELGSGPEQWGDADAARAVARAILDLTDVPAHAMPEIDWSRDRDTQATTRRHLVGFGGGHYAPRFGRIARETDWAVGHVAADWQLSELGDPEAHRDVVAQAFERSAATHAVVEGDRPALRSAIDDLGYRIVGETWVRETEDVPLDLVAAAEERLSAVADGLRFGVPARDGSVGPLGDLVAVDLPAELFATAQGVDGDAVVDALDATCVAYETEESGTLAGDRALVTAAAAANESSTGADQGDLPPELFERLLDLLRRRYDEVAVDGDRVVATETVFDPERARTLGVPEGPEFGKLSSGEAVEVDGRRITPDVVSSERRDAFEL